MHRVRALLADARGPLGLYDHTLRLDDARDDASLHQRCETMCQRSQAGVTATTTLGL